MSLHRGRFPAGLPVVVAIALLLPTLGESRRQRTVAERPLAKSVVADPDGGARLQQVPEGGATMVPRLSRRGREAA
jgi:hypothetical protein